MRAYVVLTEGHVSAVLRWIKWDCEKRLSGGCQLRVEPSSEGHFGSSPATRTTGWRRSPPELDGGFLAAFSYEKEAEAFLWLLGDDEKMKGWRSEEMTAAELASVLLGPCADVKRVVLDPLPLPPGRAMLFVGGVNREAFLRCPSQEHANIGIP